MESGDAAGGMLPSVDADTLKQAMGAWTTGVVVVTASHADGRDAGLVMVSLAPVSVDPPLVLWSVDRGSGCLDVWLGAPAFALHLLAADQEALAWQFARKGPEKRTFSANCSSGMAVTKIPDRWQATWDDNLRLAKLCDEVGLDFMLPIARWIGYGGETNFHEGVLDPVALAAGILANTERVFAFAVVGGRAAALDGARSLRHRGPLLEPARGGVRAQALRRATADPQAGAIVIAVERSRLDHALARLAGGTVGHVEFGPRWTTPVASQAIVDATWRHVCFVLATLPTPPPVARRAMEATLLDAILLGLPHSHSALLASPPAPVDAGTHAERARTWLEEHHREPVSAADVVAAVGLSVRQLQEVVRARFDLTPMQLLREIRLERARKLLSSGVAPTVTQAAMDVGCGHLSRFAAFYRERFGELPSETR